MSAATTAAHDYLRRRLRPGGVTLDATAGQGHDTAFLARWLGPAGIVHACDIQPPALEATRRRWLALPEPKAALHLHPVGHQSVHTALAALGVTQLNAIMFNLGYLPGGDHPLTTTPATTLAALHHLLPLLAPGGALTLVVYPGHPGGRAELQAVLDWASQLPPEVALARHLRLLNLGPDRAELIALEATPDDWSA